MRNDITITIGPVNSMPSWLWVGENLCQELKKYFSISTFSSFNKKPDAQIAVVVKQLPTEDFVKNIKTIYCPIDFFSSQVEIVRNRDILRRCSIILSHSYRLAPLFAKYQKTFNIDHHLKFNTEKLAEYKEDGYILWSGGYEHSPYFLKWLSQNQLKYKVKLLTNYDNPKAIRVYSGLINSLKVAETDVEKELWTNERQIETLTEAKAAIDIKGNNFSQLHKPPTKIQKYVCAGLPVAVNKESESYDYLLKLGLTPSTPDNKKLWFSKEYYEETIKLAKKLRPTLTAENIGIRYRDFIQSISR